MGIFSFSKDKGAQAISVALEELSAPDVRAKSAFFSAIPTAQHSKLEAPRLEQSVREANPESLVVRSGAKSFTAGSNATRFALHSADAQQGGAECQNPCTIQYNSISEFNQVVELYRGSISTVYRASCALTQCPVIIKAYQKALMKEKHFLRQEREVRVMRLLQGDESVVQLYNVFEDSACTYLVMEMCKGGDLFKAMLLRGGKVDEQWACTKMVVPLLRTLVKLHELHILHRDIKPENIFLTSDQTFKLGDFGLAIQSNIELPFTRSGTLDYLSPEVLGNPTCDLQETLKVTRAHLRQRGVRPYNEKVDCWAAGVLAYELVVGRPPFEVKNESKTASAIMYKNDFMLPPKYSQQWADFIVLALQKNPALRPSAAQLLEHPWIRMQTPQLERPLAVQNLSRDNTSNVDFRFSQSTAAMSALTTEEPLASRTDSLGTGNATIASASRSSSGSLTRVAPKSPTTVLSRTADLLRTFPSSPRSPQSSRFKNSDMKQLQPETGGNSFTSLLTKASPSDTSYIDSGNILEEHERAAGGMRIRMKHYFKRQA